MGRDDPDPGGEEGAPLISGSAFTHRSLSAPAFGPSGASTRYGSAPAPARGPSGSPNNVFAWRRVYTLVLAAGMGGLLLGYNSSNIAVALPLLERAFSSVATSNLLKETIVSVTTLGSAVGGFVGGFASDYYGRKSVIVASDIIFIAGAALMGGAKTSTQLIIGRSVVGIAIGTASIVVPVYIAEVSPKGIRAMLVVLYSLQIGVGLVLAFVGGFAFTVTSMGWRLILAAPAVPAFLQLLSMTFLPESPRWLAHSGRLAEADVVMRSLTATPGQEPQPGDEDTEGELREVYREGKYLRTTEGMQEAWNLRPRPIATQLAIGVGLSCLHSLAGARTIMYYSLEIISMAGFISELAMMQAVFTMGSFGTIGLMCGFFLIDRVGRRVLALVSGVGTSICLFMLAASFRLSGQHSPSSVTVPGVGDACVTGVSGMPINTCQDCLAAPGCGYCSLPPGIPGQYHEFPGHCFSGIAPGNVSALEACSGLGDGNMRLYTTGCPSGFGWMSMAALCLFQTFFQLGLGLIPAVVNAEYYPARVRGLCNGIAVSSNWLSNFLVSGTFLTFVSILGTPTTFAVYGFLVAVGTACLAFYMPETSGLSFPEIQAMFEVYGTPGAPPVWRLHEGRPKVDKADREKGVAGGAPASGPGCDYCATQQVASSGPSVAISLADVLVRDVMTKPPTLVRPDTSVFDVLELLVSKSISGVPVVDSAGKVLGMISGYDLLVLDATPGHMDKADGMFPKIGRCEEFGGSLSRMWMAFSEQQELIQKTGGSTAGEVCHDAATVADTARLEDAADVIVRRKVHRLAVVDAQGKCVGVLSRGDILKATLNRLRAMSGR